MVEISKLEEIALQIRRDVIRMVNSAASGHPGGSLSSADFLTALFFAVMEHNPKEWSIEGKGRDMFFLSAGHISPVYYSILARSGYFPVKDLATFRKLGSPLQGHPSVEWSVPGVHISTGSLGQGLSVACGAAIAKKLDGDSKWVYAMVGDGESEEGQIWEAALFAAKHKVDNLIAVTDWNGQQIDGSVDSVLGLGDLYLKWSSFGWDCKVVEGHDMVDIIGGYEWVKSMRGDGKPKMLLMKSCMGKGVDFMEGTHLWHGKAPNAEETERALSQLGITELGDF